MPRVTFSLPDELAHAARSSGLLEDEAIATLLRDALRKREVDRLFDTMDKLAALEPSLTEAEIDAEMVASRISGRRS